MDDFALDLSSEEQARIHPWQRRVGSVELTAIPEVRAMLAAFVPDEQTVAFTEESPTEAVEYVQRKYVDGEDIAWNAAGEGMAAKLLAHGWSGNPLEPDPTLDPTEKPLWPLVDSWVLQAGAVGATQALLEEHRVTLAPEWDDAIEAWVVVPVSNPRHQNVSAYVGKALRLRQILCSVPNAEYDEAREWAARRRSEADSFERCLLAYLFPAEVDWAVEAARGLTPTQSQFWQTSADVLLLIPSLPDVASVEPLIRDQTIDQAYSDGRMLTLLARHGAEAARLLLSLARSSSYGAHRAIECLFPVRSREVAAAIAELVGRERTGDAAREYLGRHPALGIVALAERLASSNRNKIVVKGLIEDLMEEHPDIARGVGDVSRGKTKTGAKRTRAAGKATTPKLPRGVQRLLDEPDSDLSPQARAIWARLGERLRAGERALEDELGSLARTGELGAARRVGTLARSWSAADDQQAALEAIAVLSAAANDASIGQLVLLRDLPVARAMSHAAEKAVAKLQRRKRLSEEDLQDRKVSNFGLGGALELDLGSRKFRIAIGEGLTPTLCDEHGKVTTQFPRPRKTDDPACVARSKVLWDAIRTDGAAELRAQARRLEEAMVEERSFEARSLVQVLVPHALLGFLARRVVWATERGGELITFRVAEDGTFADENDDTLVLGADERVRIVHPLALADGIALCSERLADYELVQPFEQLGRACWPEAEAKRTLANNQLDLGKKARFVLVGLGWNEGDFQYDGVELFRTRRGRAMSVTLMQAGGDRFSGWLYVDVDKLDAIGASELLRDLTKCGLRTS